MEIIVSARHFDLSESVRQHAVEVIEASFSDLRLKVSKATMVIDQQRNLIKAQLVVNIKEFQVEASSEAYDNMYKAVDEAVLKAETQARKYLDKKQDHKKEKDPANKGVVSAGGEE